MISLAHRRKTKAYQGQIHSVFHHPRFDSSITILLLFLTIFNFLPQKYQVLHTIQRSAEQGKDFHGMKDKDFTPEFMQKVRGLIRTS